VIIALIALAGLAIIAVLAAAMLRALRRLHGDMRILREQLAREDELDAAIARELRIAREELSGEPPVRHLHLVTEGR
jgi:type II secretory pathway component PulJ